MTENKEDEVISEPILRVEDVSKSFRGLRAVSGYNLALREGEILGIIGPNGAGKTTVFHLITGFLKPSSGRVYFRGKEITGTPPPRIAKLGLARTFQNIRLFDRLTVLENVTVAAQLHTNYNIFEVFACLPSFRRKEKRVRDDSLELLKLLGLADLRDRRVDGLAYGDKRRLEIARALATRPKILLLDEPAAGTNPHESDQLHEMILSLRRTFALTVVLVEHDMRLMMNLCERLQALNYGEVIAEGTPEEVRQHPDVIVSYLGTSGTTQSAVN
ncbi:MAG: ABC transporter ATP-binding protein [Candidatus Hydrogenedentes bacterium]|nr:ABC transporter ATP-binding protein [Candidatus Hydrogenedentota bacterium]